MQSLKSPYTLYNQQSVGSTLHNNLLFITNAAAQPPLHGGVGFTAYPTVQRSKMRSALLCA